MATIVSLDDLLMEQSIQLDQLTMATAFIHNRSDMMSQLMEAHSEVSTMRKGLDTMCKELEKMKQQNTHCLELSAMLETLSKRIIHMEQNIPPKLINDCVNLDKNFPTQTLMQRLSSASQKSAQVEEILEEDKENTVKNCKKVLFNEPEKLPRLEFLSEEEFKDVPKYMIGRQTLDAVNSFISTINETLKAKYSLLAMGKNGARKRGELDLYLSYKRQQNIKDKAAGPTYFFTPEDYQRHTQSKLDKSRLNLLTVLRHCKRLTQEGSGKTMHYIAITSTCSRSTQSMR